MSFVWFSRLIDRCVFAGSQMTGQWSGFRAPPGFFLRDHYCISTLACHPGLQHWFALLWNQQIKRSVGASNSYDIHQTTRHCQLSFRSQLNRFNFNLRHFPLWNLEQLIGEEGRKQMLLSPFKRSRENRASSLISTFHTNGGKMNVPCPKVIDFKLSIQITSELDFCPWRGEKVDYMKCPVTVTDHMNFEPTFKTDGISCKWRNVQTILIRQNRRWFAWHPPSNWENKSPLIEFSPFKSGKVTLSKSDANSGKIQWISSCVQ